jgi:hypothetical protein
MGITYWDLIASIVAKFVELNYPQHIVCKVRIDDRPKGCVVVAFVGSVSAMSCAHFISEIESQGYAILGEGISETSLHWAVIVDLRDDQNLVGCVAYELSAIG